jgi:hypothetical protein|tara:strand:+ start:234 stop:515 length:282 start_codon:yes stop_codon:yes gene_type:complete
MSMKKTTKHFDDLMKCLQEKTLDMSQDIVEKKCRETYIKGLSEIISRVLLDNKYYDRDLKSKYGLKHKDINTIRASFKQLMNDNFDELWGERK